jgi:hypothetical protein
MGEINWLAVVLGTVAFFALGALWYGPLFSKPWMKEVGFTEEAKAEISAKGGGHMAKIMTASFLLELLVAVVLGHMVARSSGSPQAVMMFAVGLGAAVMAPAIGINYLYQNRSLKLFAIDAGYLVVGMAAMGAVFVLLG